VEPKPKPGSTGLLDRLASGVKIEASPNAATGPLRAVPKERIAQEVWKVVIQGMAGSQVKSMSIEVKGLIVVGRLDPDSDAKPDVDLTPYGAVVHGISRQHVILFLTDEGPCVMDLNSTNGTWINGLYLEPGRKYRLRTGDRVELGSLKLLLRVLAPAEQETPIGSGDIDSTSAAIVKPKASELQAAHHIAYQQDNADQDQRGGPQD
jgi:hypothetical protein